jgi:hypothetical protein
LDNQHFWQKVLVTFGEPYLVQQQLRQQLVVVRSGQRIDGELAAIELRAKHTPGQPVRRLQIDQPGRVTTTFGVAVARDSRRRNSRFRSLQIHCYRPGGLRPLDSRSRPTQAVSYSGFCSPFSPSSTTKAVKNSVPVSVLAMAAAVLVAVEVVVVVVVVVVALLLQFRAIECGTIDEVASRRDLNLPSSNGSSLLAIQQEKQKFPKNRQHAFGLNSTCWIPSFCRACFRRSEFVKRSAGRKSLARWSARVQVRFVSVWLVFVCPGGTR